MINYLRGEFKLKAKRHAKILEIIKNHSIDTQEELLTLLKKSGFNVTQATVSRDIKELKLVKTHTIGDRYRYSTSQRNDIDMHSKLFSIFSDSIIDVEYAGNIVVVKTISGTAQAVCAAFDSAKWQGVVGTIAGDDTIFIATKSEESAISFSHELKKMIAGG